MFYEKPEIIKTASRSFTSFYLYKILAKIFRCFSENVLNLCKILRCFAEKAQNLCKNFALFCAQSTKLCSFCAFFARFQMALRCFVLRKMRKNSAKQRILRKFAKRCTSLPARVNSYMFLCNILLRNFAVKRFSPKRFFSNQKLIILFILISIIIHL